MARSAVLLSILPCLFAGRFSDRLHTSSNSTHQRVELNNTVLHNSEHMVHTVHKITDSKKRRLRKSRNVVSYDDTEHTEHMVHTVQKITYSKKRRLRSYDDTENIVATLKNYFFSGAYVGDVEKLQLSNADSDSCDMARKHINNTMVQRIIEFAQDVDSYIDGWDAAVQFLTHIPEDEWHLIHTITYLEEVLNLVVMHGSVDFICQKKRREGMPTGKTLDPQEANEDPTPVSNITGKTLDPQEANEDPTPVSNIFINEWQQQIKTEWNRVRSLPKGLAEEFWLAKEYADLKMDELKRNESHRVQMTEEAAEEARIRWIGKIIIQGQKIASGASS